jgi:hypothetical protein
MEALAARTIAERGVKLIATAHGNTLDNLLLNPTLSDLVGGIESVTLSDEEARRRGTQKTVLERRAPPTFDILVEIQERHRLLVREDVTEAVDTLLRGFPLTEEIRTREAGGKVHVEIQRAGEVVPEQQKRAKNGRARQTDAALPGVRRTRKLKEQRIYPFGIARNRLLHAAKNLHVPIQIVDNLKEANIFVTTKQYYRKRPRIVVDAERRGIPLYVLRANTTTQMESLLGDTFGLTEKEMDPMTRAMGEAENAITRVLNGEQSINLTPQDAFIRRYQHEMARKANLNSRSFGKEPYRAVRIYRNE